MKFIDFSTLVSCNYNVQCDSSIYNNIFMTSLLQNTNCEPIQTAVATYDSPEVKPLRDEASWTNANKL